MHLHHARHEVHREGPWFAAGMLTYLLIFLLIAAVVVAGYFFWARTVGPSGPTPQAPAIQQPAPGGQVAPGPQQAPGGGAAPSGPQQPPGGGVAPLEPMQPAAPGGGGGLYGY